MSFDLFPTSQQVAKVKSIQPQGGAVLVVFDIDGALLFHRMPTPCTVAVGDIVTLDIELYSQLRDSENSTYNKITKVSGLAAGTQP